MKENIKDLLFAIGLCTAAIASTVGVLEWLEHRHPSRAEVKAVHSDMQTRNLIEYADVQQSVSELELEALEKEAQEYEAQGVPVPSSTNMRKERAKRKLDYYSELEQKMKKGDDG